MWVVLQWEEGRLELPMHVHDDPPHIGCGHDLDLGCSPPRGLVGDRQQCFEDGKTEYFGGLEGDESMSLAPQDLSSLLEG